MSGVLLLLCAATVRAAPADDTFVVAGQRVSMAALLRAGAHGEGAVRGRTGRVLVGLHADADPAAVTRRADVAGARRLATGAWTLTPAAGVDDLALARELASSPGVRWAHPDLLVRLDAAEGPADPWVAEQWHLENTGQGGRTPDVDIDATTAWAFATGAGQLVAILDSGVQLDHPDLSVIAGGDYVAGDRDPSPDPADGWGAPHGTAAAGVAAAIGGDGRGGAGVAWDADVYALRIIGGNSSLESLQQAFAEAVDAGAGVLSNSWGWGDCADVPAYGIFDEMFTYAERYGRGGLGSVIVFAAGNGNCDIERDGMLAQDFVVAVAAVEGDDVRAGYSSFGRHVDIAAPTSLLTTDMVPGGYGSYAGDDAWADGYAGTSAATPVVSGVVALMLEANPRLTARDVREVLCDTAVRNDAAHAGYDSRGWSPYYGCGRVDAGAAVAAVANTAPGAPVPAATTLSVAHDRGVLRWSPAPDADAEPLTYEVQWTRAADAEPQRARTVTTTLDLRGALQPGDVLTWSVRAHDAWGPGPWSEIATWTVDAAPVAPTPTPAEGGCATVAGAPGAGVLAGVLFLAAGRARRSSGTRGRRP